MKSSGVAPPLSAAARLGASLFLVGGLCLGCAGQGDKVRDPSKGQETALGYLKEADVELEKQTIASAEAAIELSTEGLSWAPPSANSKSWTVARLLLVRARAQSELARYDAALNDLEAARSWAARDQGVTPELEAELLLVQAEILMRQSRLEEASAALVASRTKSAGLGKTGAALHCEALLLQGDVSTRLGKSRPTPETHYKAVFRVASRYDYPEGTWDTMESALMRLELPSGQANALMGPVPERRQKKREEEEKKRRRRARIGNPLHQGITSSGSVPGADLVIGELRPKFRDCYRRAQSDDPSIGGTIQLEIAVGPDGSVGRVSSNAQGLPRTVISCVEGLVRSAQFSPPSTGEAVLNVRVSVVSQTQASSLPPRDIAGSLAPWG